MGDDIPEICKFHREEMNDLRDKVELNNSVSAKTIGRFTAMLWFLWVIGAALSIGIVVIITQLSNIQTLFTTIRGDVGIQGEQIRGLRKDIDELQRVYQYREYENLELQKGKKRHEN